MLQLKKILVPRDFSPCGEEALKYALDLARRVGAEVRLLFVEVLLDVPDPTATHPSYRRILRERLLEDIKPELVEETPDSEEVQIKPALVSDVAPARNRRSPTPSCWNGSARSSRTVPSRERGIEKSTPVCG